MIYAASRRFVRARAQLSARGRSQLRRGAPVGTPPNRPGPTTNLLVLLSYAQPNKLQYKPPVNIDTCVVLLSVCYIY